MTTAREPRWLLDRVRTPLGELVLVACEAGYLRQLGFVDEHPRMRAWLALHRPTEVQNPFGFTTSVEHYLQGDRDAFTQVSVKFEGTKFQVSVWEALRQIPFGETWSYKNLAAFIGNPKAVRAVGLANGQNPIAIVVPCHRVIGADGSLTGFGAGVWRKEWLLHHEGAREAKTAQALLPL